jgi:acyl dehydratase
MSTDLVVGATRDVFVDNPLSIADFVRYQGASGDLNPIHYDQSYAARAGYDSPFAVGMRQAGVLANYATEWLGDEHLRKFRVQFREQAWPGDILRYSGVVTDIRQGADGVEVDVALECRRQTDGVHILGWATFVQ